MNVRKEVQSVLFELTPGTFIYNDLEEIKDSNKTGFIQKIHCLGLIAADTCFELSGHLLPIYVVSNMLAQDPSPEKIGASILIYSTLSVLQSLLYRATSSPTNRFYQEKLTKYIEPLSL
jgi:hypothetical protein